MEQHEAIRELVKSQKETLSMISGITDRQKVQHDSVIALYTIMEKLLDTLQAATPPTEASAAELRDELNRQKDAIQVLVDSQLPTETGSSVTLLDRIIKVEETLPTFRDQLVYISGAYCNLYEVVEKMAALAGVKIPPGAPISGAVQ